MPDERTEPARPSWKRKAARAPRPERSTHEWNKREPKPAGAVKLPWSGRFKLASALVGFVACLVAIIVLIIMIRRPPPAAVVLVGADYADNAMVPHNVLGWEGIAGIEKLSKTPARWSLLPPASLQLIRQVQVIDHRERWDALIEGLAKTRFSQKTLLIVVELHGGSDPDHGYLIPDKMSSAEERLDLAHVIDSMRKLPSNKQKILVVEGAQIPANWQLGMMHNDFARRLQDLEPEIQAVENLWVLSAADIDQRCWVSEGLGRTVFSHFIIDGLRGKAAGSDGSLTLAGLYAYVRENVRNWVWKAREAIQEPVLLPRPASESQVAATEGNPKPKAKAGKPVARNAASDVFLASVEHAPAPQAPGPPDRRTLEEVWQTFHKLDALVPHPVLYSPRRWRQYRADLVRYEQLVRAGGSAKAGPVRERIDAVARSLESDRFLNRLPKSAENTLVMNVVAGGGLETASAEPKELLPFWDATGRSDAAKEWESLRASEHAAVDGRPSLRTRIDDFLLRRAIAEPAKNLEPAAVKLAISENGSDFPQPAEAHYLRMLHLWREREPLASPTPRWWGLVKQALAVRRLAERSAVAASENTAEYSYGEQVYPWIKKQIEAADNDRRRGEDQLFSSQETVWDQSEAAFALARTGYLEAVRRAGIIRTALAAHDRSLAILPDYSRWLAHRYSDELQNDLVSAVENLWVLTHQLTARLGNPQSDADLVPLSEASHSLSRGLLELTRRFDDQGSRPNEDWEATAAAAAVPFPDTGDLAKRSRIWERLDNIGQHDRELAESDKSEPAHLSDDDRVQDAGRVRRRAQIQGLMAMSALGESRFDKSGNPQSREKGDFDSTIKRIRRAAENEGERAGTWWQELADAGSLIGERWQRMAPVIDDLADEKNGIAKFDDFENRLWEADRLGRQLDRAAPRLEESAIEPTARLRQARVHDLLLEMARRAWLDHWFDEKPNDTPYYRLASTRFVSDASKLFPDSPRVREVQEQLKDGKLEVTGPARRVLTSELATSLVYKIQTVGQVPDGIPVFKPVLDQLELVGDRAGFRTLTRKAGSDSVEFAVSSPLIRQAETDPKLDQPRIAMAALTVEGAFRGQPLTFRTEVQLHPVANTVAIGPPPPDPAGASIAIRASQEIIDEFAPGSGSIAIVLDCSGSMLDRSGVGGKTKFDDAQDALRDVLKLVPSKTRLSLWTFSQLPPNAILLADGNVDPNSIPPGLDKEPERTISRLLPPEPWDPNRADGLVERIKQLKPYLHTPLVQAMWQVANSDLKAATGMKTLLVLTDGDDDRLKDNPKYNPNKMTPSEFVVAGFKPLNIRVNMIFFTPAGDKREIARARQNFEGALKQLDPPGNFVLANNLNELIVTLKRGLRQKLTCQILKPPDWTQVGEEPLDVTGPDDVDDKWWTSGLEPGIYKLRVHADKPYNHEIDLKKGDRVIIRLVDGPDDGIAFERALYSNDDHQFAKRVQGESGGWRLAALADQRRPQGDKERLQLFAALERKPDAPGPGRLQQIEPRMAWFRVEAADHPDANFSLRWQEQIFYPGPTWQFDVPRWVADPAGEGLAKPILTAWWRGPEATFEPPRVFALDPPGNPGELPRSLQVEDGKTVIIESLGVEEHDVTVRLGEPLVRESCLVVRLAFPKNTPYLVDPERLAGLQIVGYEHRLYDRAGKYTGIFWPVNQPSFEKLSSLSLIALDAFRNQAETANCKVAIKLPPPRTDDQLPKPPSAIVKGD